MVGGWVGVWLGGGMYSVWIWTSTRVDVEFGVHRRHTCAHMPAHVRAHARIQTADRESSTMERVCQLLDADF